MSKSFQPIDLSRLPHPTIAETLSYEAILAERRAYLIGLWPSDERDEIAERIKLDSDPLHKLLQENAYRELLLRQRVNEAATATMLALATGRDLDQVAAATNTGRLLISAATQDMPAEYESDEDLRRRAQMAWEGLSTAGPVNSYIYHTLSADGRVADAECVSPSPAVVDIIVLSREGNGAADASLLATVERYLNAEDRRPVADRVVVKSAEIIEYRVNASLYLSTVGAEQEPILKESRARLESFVSQQRRIALEISESALHAALHIEGVSKVVLHDWQDIKATAYQSTYCTEIALEVIV